MRKANKCLNINRYGTSLAASADVANFICMRNEEINKYLNYMNEQKKRRMHRKKNENRATDEKRAKINL